MRGSRRKMFIVEMTWVALIFLTGAVVPPEYSGWALALCAALTAAAFIIAIKWGGAWKWGSKR